MYVNLCILFLALVASVTKAQQSLTLQNGLINGTIGKSPSGREFLQFYGIPYAEPPIGALRFQPPVPAKPWGNKVKNTIVEPPICVQPQNSFSETSPLTGQEDCLYINVFTPLEVFKKPRKAPVIVFIHGGQFLEGYGSLYNPHYFMEKDIIFVTLNYRLGIFGFLGANNDQISGNFGLKDQSLALKWIKENIAKFGGDPDNVTLMGNSAGAAAAHLHMFSPLSKGLFHKAIMQSGTAIAPWSYYDEIDAQAFATAFIMLNGCVNKDAGKVLKCLQDLPTYEIYKSSNKLHIWDVEPDVLFRPIIESKVKNQPFLPNRPSKDTYQSAVPWLASTTSGEGAVKVMRYYMNDGALAKIVNKAKKHMFPLINQYLYTAERENFDFITQKLTDYYFGSKDIGVDTALKFVDMITDSTFAYYFIKAVRTYPHQRYAYFYDHRGSASLQDRANLTINLGVCHGDELFLIFRFPGLDAKWTPQDKRVSEALLKYLTNFAIYTDPNGPSKTKTWNPVTSNELEYLHIKSDSNVMQKNLLKERYEFWESLPTGRKFA